MVSSPPVRVPTRLCWQLPASQAAALPAWLVKTVGLLEATGEAVCPLPGSSDGAGAERVVLCLDVASAAGFGADRCWLLTEGDGQALPIDAPLVEAVTGGRGIGLALWQRAPSEPHWSPLRTLHVGVSALYASAHLHLPHAIARLLRQACVDSGLGVPAGPPATGPLAARLGRPSASKRLPRALLWLRGLWRETAAQHRARWLREVWRIGVIDAPLGQVIANERLPPVRWLDAPRDLGYWADPIADAASENHLYAEFFDDRTGLGRIERLRVGPDGRIDGRVIMPLGGGAHVSFPLVLDLDGRRLGLVETAARRECVLHEIETSGTWRPLCTLLQGVAAADPALFKWQGRYWLAYTDIDQGAGDNLCLQHAPALEGPWQPHANNPVKVDVTGARMGGGLFWHDGELYRPAQNCMPTYGSALVVQRVLRCTPTEYAEEAVRRFAPDPQGICPNGMHTLNAWGSRTLIDGKRTVFSPSALWLKTRKRMGWRP